AASVPAAAAGAGRAGADLRQPAVGGRWGRPAGTDHRSLNAPIPRAGFHAICRLLGGQSFGSQATAAA
ncbi:MAG TPA: hypothetical protein VFX03_07855, partial [Thermomicrobiales bacterium]|nr:hypothetical protein [Thermomicrobiales bacterium]